MSRTRDKPDPSNIIVGSRGRGPSTRLVNPNNSEPLDVSHRGLVTESVSEIVALIDELKKLCPALPSSILVAAANDRIPTALKMGGQEGGDHGTFIRHMDLLFGMTARNEDGRLINIRRGRWGIEHIVKYLESIDWRTSGIDLLLANVKMTQLRDELNFIIANPNTIPVVPVVDLSVSTPSTPGKDDDVEDGPERGRQREKGKSKASPTENTDGSGPSKPLRKRKRTTSQSSPDAVDKDGLLADIPVVIDIDLPMSTCWVRPPQYKPANQAIVVKLNSPLRMGLEEANS
ncbi:hypothetical protein K438DRAFT_1984763 [Mycena galopus ATCC 62051]|nr:hypothetical protein K438DRAFT_1984763 [Mycena galopus ATCC 62051]